MKVPVCEPSIGEQELKNVSESVKSGWISGYKGKCIDDFEALFAAYCGVKYAVTTTSCATALLLALESLGKRNGFKDVITTDFTMIATVSAIIHAGLKPVFVDVEPDTWNISPELIKRKITKETFAVMPVPIYGHPVDSIIREIAEHNTAYTIEDAAEAIGSEHPGNYRVGSQFNASCFSFYINKTITTGEGGMIVTNSEWLAKMARRLKGYDTDPDNRFVHQELGFNYRMTNMQAAIGVVQMSRVMSFVEKKRHIADFYRSRLGKYEKLTMPVERPGYKNSYWVFGILVNDGTPLNRNILMNKLAEKGVETRAFFTPMHKQPALIKLGVCTGKETEFIVSDRISRQGLYLPNGVTLTESQLEYVCDCIEGVVRG